MSHLNTACHPAVIPGVIPFIAFIAITQGLAACPIPLGMRIWIYRAVYARHIIFLFGYALILLVIPQVSRGTFAKGRFLSGIPLSHSLRIH